MSENVVIPSARRLMKSLRDVGYEFVTAVADLIDNSIGARAKTVRIDVVWAGESSYVTIADDGHGMSIGTLREAMRFGSEREYAADDLGKFGLGLKTASLSQCRRFTVATRYNTARADINGFCWDIDHVEKANSWEILPVKAASLHERVRQHLRDTTGTVVVWEKLDRILGYKKPDGEAARKQIYAMCRALEDHLSMVFHRFLAGEVRGKRLKLVINGNDIAPWDPFARSEAKTKPLEVKTIAIEGDDAKGHITIAPFVLPHKSQFSSPEAHNRASGPEKWNRQQGFYIYRADRMIQSGGWCGIRAMDEHIKLARIALSFSPTLDQEFKINVAKMKVQLPSTARDAITKVITPVITIANDDYRKRENKGTSATGASQSQRQDPGAAGHVKGGTAVQHGNAVVGTSSSGATGTRGHATTGQPSDGELDRVCAFLRSFAQTAEEFKILEALSRRARNARTGVQYDD